MASFFIWISLANWHRLPSGIGSLSKAKKEMVLLLIDRNFFREI
jgi:hypothetical protein